jgi:regulatory protein
VATEQVRAVELAYRAISQRDRTVAEVRAFLERKRVEPGDIDHAVGELQAEGWLDDARFAQRFAEDKRHLEKWGGDRIGRDLARRGVPADLIEAALEGQDRAGALAAAGELLATKHPQGLPDDRARDRAWRLLVRKGYESDLAYDAVRTHAGG